MSYSHPLACDLCEVVASSDVLNDVAVTMIAKSIEMMAGTLAERMAGRKGR